MSLIIAEPVQTSTPAKIKQIDGLQIIRAVAVLLVAWLHAGQMMDPWRTVELPHFAAFGIDIFFVISGFIMSSILLKTKQGPGPGAMWAFLKRRLIRIFPIYWIFALLESARLIHGHGFSPGHLPSFLLLPALRYPLVMSFSWTMVFEMFFYYTLSLILLVTVKKAVPVSIALLSGAVLVGEIIGVKSVWVVFFSPLLLEFIFGAVAALAFHRFGKQKMPGIYLLAMGVLMALYLRAYPEQGGAAGMTMAVSLEGAMRHVLTWGLSAALIVAGMVFWLPSVKPGNMAVALGNASYSAYLASALLIEFTARFLIRLGAPSVAKVALFQTLIVGVVFLGGWLSYHFIEWPMTRWLQEKL